MMRARGDETVVYPNPSQLDLRSRLGGQFQGPSQPLPAKNGVFDGQIFEISLPDAMMNACARRTGTIQASVPVLTFGRAFGSNGHQTSDAPL